MNIIRRICQPCIILKGDLQKLGLGRNSGLGTSFCLKPLAKIYEHKQIDYVSQGFILLAVSQVLHDDDYGDDGEGTPSLKLEKYFISSLFYSVTLATKMCPMVF